MKEGNLIFGIISPNAICEAVFVRRPNRFVVECLIGGTMTRVHLPNPGRLLELLLPGVKLYLTRNAHAPGRETKYTVVAVEKEGFPVMLHTHLTNSIADLLIRKGCVPGLEGYCVVKSEVAMGKSRFDFLLEKNGSTFFLEVKSCTLFGRKIAMFPDAITARGKRHLLELAKISREGGEAGVLFIVHSPSAAYFMPEYHTDLEFSRTLTSVRHEILVRALSPKWTSDLSFSGEANNLEIPWELIEKEALDRGSYILIVYLKRKQRIPIGLEEKEFQSGYYVYAGSAMTNLAHRIGRHRRQRKRFFWHIDYLREKAEFIAAFPVRASVRLECEIADSLKTISDWTIDRFGSSDCSCKSHLFAMKKNPLVSPSFAKLLQYFRIDRLEEELKKSGLGSSGTSY